MKRVERTALPKATSHDLKDLCEGAPFKCPKCLKMISLKWWSLYNNNNIWSFPSCRESLLSNYKFGPGMQIFNDVLCCQNPSVAISSTYYWNRRKLFCCGANQHHTANLQWRSRTDDAQVENGLFSQYGYSFIDSKAIVTCHVKRHPLHFPCLQLCVHHFPSLRRTNSTVPSESDPVWLNACKHFLSLHTIQKVLINPKSSLVKTM